MPLTLTWRDATRLPVEADGLRPDEVAGLSADEVARLPVAVGNGLAEVGELFAVAGEAGDGRVVVEGDLRRVRRLGQGMAAGALIVRGDCGDHLAGGMSGGEVDLIGSAGAWAGAEMRGGFLRIRGDAGDHLGAAYPGSRLGMREGVILVEGAAGIDAGLAMRRGLIAVLGAAGDGLGRAMVAGSAFAFGPIGRHPGSAMKRGTIALFGGEAPDLSPGFAPSGRDRPPFVSIYLRQLRAWGFPVPEAAFGGAFRRYNGDRLEHGQGEILAWGG